MMYVWLKAQKNIVCVCVCVCMFAYAAAVPLWLEHWFADIRGR